MRGFHYGVYEYVKKCCYVAAINIHVQVFCVNEFSLLLNIYLGVELLDHTTTFNLVKIYQVVNQRGHTMYNPTGHV